MLDEMTSCAYSTVLDEVFGCEKSGFSRLFGTLQDFNFKLSSILL